MAADTLAERRLTAFAFVALALWLTAIVFLRRLSIDESQYVASAVLTAKGLLPYRDYAYLQTPLQPFAFAPLQWLFAGHVLIAMRLANALLGAATIMLVFGAARRMGAQHRAALAAAAMLAICEAFTWSVGVARNDMLPAMLMMLGLFAMAKGESGPRMFGAGLALGLAAGVKISYAIPAATMFLASVWTRDAAERRNGLAFAAGIAVGLLPSVILILIAPQAFVREALVFPALGPEQYYTEIGKAWRLGPNRFFRLLITAAIGPALIASIEVGRRCWRQPALWLGDRTRRLMLAAALGGLISAALNRPFQIFYLLPALPPLFALSALLFIADERRPAWLKGVWALSAGVGLMPVAAWAVIAASAGIAPALDAQRRTEALGAALRAQHISGPIATLAGQYVPDANAEIDPRFAAGPFLYRTRGFISAEQAREWQVVTRDQPGSLAERPPSAIVTGTYPDVQPAQEAELTAQARALGYRPRGAAAGFIIWQFAKAD
ncbi:MAG: phospholipid carrier-dependent glycosyltransferase [Pseudomonadota bacterium]